LDKILEFLTKEIIVFLTAATPIIELRGAIPLGISFGLSPLHALGISLAGSVLPVPVILFTIRPVFNYMKQTKLFRQLVHRLSHKTLNKSDNIKRYGFWGLLIFVAIPLPGTGVWSGSLAAALLDMRIRIALPAILIGNLIAGLIMLGASSAIATALFR